jgi:hypothetical protein
VPVEVTKFPVFPPGGMDEGLRAEPGTAAEIKNMTQLRDGSWQQAGGWIALTDSLSSIGDIMSLHWFVQKSGAVEWCLFEQQLSSSHQIGYVNIADGGSTAIQAGRTRVTTPSPGIQWMESNNWVYWFSRYDGAWRWNGRELVQVGFTAIPPAPTLRSTGPDLMALDRGTIPVTEYDPVYQRGVGGIEGNGAPWTYAYAVTGINDRGMESPPSPTVFLQGENPSGAGAGLDGRLSILLTMDIPPGHWRGLRVYRSPNIYTEDRSFDPTNTTLYRHSEWQVGGPFTLVDDHPDSELGSELGLTTLGLFPAGVQYAVRHKNTLFVDGGPEFPEQLRYSAPIFIEQMPVDNTLSLGGQAAGPITGLFAARNSLVGFKRRAIFLIKGDPANGFYDEVVTEFTGHTGGRALVEVPGQGVFFVADEGPYLLVGALENTGTPTTVEYLGREIEGTWERVTKSALANARAVLNHLHREVWLHVPVDGDDRPTLGLAYNYTTGRWSLRPGYPSRALTVMRNHHGHMVFGGLGEGFQGGGGHAGIWVYTHGVSDIDGDAIDPRYTSGWFAFQNRAIVAGVGLILATYSRDSIVEWRIDRRQDWRSTADGDYPQADSEYDRDVWGTALWGTSTSQVWYTADPSTVRVDFQSEGAFEFQFRVRAGRIKLAGYDLLVQEPHDIVKRSLVGE